MDEALFISRRGLLGAGLGCLALGAFAAGDAQPTLAAPDARAFRAWFAAILEETVRRGPSPRWMHRDCAGLVRFAAREALVPHDARWLRAMGWPNGQPQPPDVELSPRLAQAMTRWLLPDGQRSEYASALALVQGNTRALGQAPSGALAADLLFFDQGGEQHLMAWTGRRVIYHTGSEPTPQDSGLRSTTLAALLRHPDTRWRPTAGNTNFAGWFRFHFLAP